METVLKVRTAVKILTEPLVSVQVFEYRKPDIIAAVREETLELWQRDLLKEAEEFRSKLRRALGGLVQIDQEITRRKESKERRAAP